MNRAEQNTWRITQGKEPVRTVQEVIKKLQDYVNTYATEQWIDEYTDDRIIDDFIYGLGIALSEDYKSRGYAKFKELLINKFKKDKR